MRAMLSPRDAVKSTSRLLFEAVLIVLSVAIGFAVQEWRERADDRELAARVLRNVRAEVEYNIKQVEEQIGRHQKMIEAMRAADLSNPKDTAWAIMVRTLKGGPGAAPLRRAAWDGAVSMGALRVIDYDMAARLSEIYVAQDVYGLTVANGPQLLYTPTLFDPATRGVGAQIVEWMMVELEGNETFVLDVYQRHLPALRAATE
jgi:hypothetical protein